MPRRTTIRELSRFLDHLAETGNFALAADRIGRAKSGLLKRRARDPHFAARCAAALAIHRASNPFPSSEEGDSRAERERGEGSPVRKSTPFRTAAGALHLHVTRDRPPQLRRAHPGRLTPAGVAAFLEALAATANIRLSAASVGVAASSVHARRRRDPDFAKAWDQCLKLGCDRLEFGLLEQALAAAEGTEPPPLPAWERRGLDPAEPGDWDDPAAFVPPEVRVAPMTLTDALALLSHHRRQTRREQQRRWRKRRTMDDVRASIMRKIDAIRRFRGDA